MVFLEGRSLVKAGFACFGMISLENQGFETYATRDPQPDPTFTAYLTHTPHMATMPRNMVTLEAKSLPNDLHSEPKWSQFDIKN